MNSYESKQEERRERYEARADKARQESEDRFQASRRATAGIPFGQPILVGHHSEKRHRAALSRSDSHMQKSCEAQKKAEHYDQKAEGVGRAGISSDDPAAVIKLQERIEELETKRDKMKAVNKEWKARGEEKPYAPYVFSNASANIRRLKQRLERTKEEAARPERAPIEGTGGGVSYTVEESKEDNRIYFRFPDGKPKPAILEIMKRGGWRWKRTERAWSRMLNNAGRYAAEWAVKDIQKVTT